MSDDITRCIQAQCPLAPDCQRQRTAIGDWTSTAAFDFDENGCEYFIAEKTAITPTRQTIDHTCSSYVESFRTHP